MSNIILYAHQKEVLDWGPKFQHLNPERFGLFFAPRTGKTFILKGLLEKYNIIKALIIVPKGIVEQWRELMEPFGHIVVTKEEFRRDHKILPKCEAFIFDEAHHASNIKSKLTKACLWYLKEHNPKYRWLATGTPYRSSPMSIFGLGMLLGKDWNYWRFFNKFYVNIKMGSRMIPKIRPHMESELEKYVRAIGMTLRIEDVVETKEGIIIREEIELTEEQLKAISELDEPIPISRFTKIHEIEQGFLKGDDYIPDKQYPSNKVERIVEIGFKHKKIAIICRYTAQIEYLKNLYWGDKIVFVISGSSIDRAKIVKDVEKSVNCVVIIQSACGEGYDISSIDTMIFASMSFSHSDHIQIKDRIVRMDRPKINTYYYLLSGKIDKLVYANIMRKMDFHMQIFAQKFINYDNIDI